MRSKYYKKRGASMPSVPEMVIEILFRMFFFTIEIISEIIFRIVYEVFSLLADLFYQTTVSKKTSQISPLEIEPIPNTSFAEGEDMKEVYLPYRKKNYLLTKSEYFFDKVLTEAVGDRYYIGRQVPLSSIVEVTSTYKPYRSKIDKKTIDFVIFNKEGYTPHLAIELDDSSHLRPDRINRDNFVRSVLNKVGINLKRIKASYQYNLEDIRKIIE